jgi:hypothetical protein
LRKGKVFMLGLLVGDCARKYDKMGEVPDEGTLMRWEVAEADKGVGISVGEPAEPEDELEETDKDRGRPLGNADGAIGIGFVESVGERLFDMVRMWGSRKG